MQCSKTYVNLTAYMYVTHTAKRLMIKITAWTIIMYVTHTAKRLMIKITAWTIIMYVTHTAKRLMIKITAWTIIMYVTHTAKRLMIKITAWTIIIITQCFISHAGGTPLVVHFINDSPRIVGSDTIEADFAVQGPIGSRVSCHLTGLSPKDCKLLKIGTLKNTWLGKMLFYHDFHFSAVGSSL